MTEKQKMFADEYLIDLNATRAYRAVYKTIKNDGVARRNGSRLLTNADIEKTADAQEVMEYLTAVLRGESTSEEIVVEGLGDGMSEARTMEKKPSERDRLKAAELLGKRFGLYTDKVEMDADMDLNITIDYGEDDTG